LTSLALPSVDIALLLDRHRRQSGGQQACSLGAHHRAEFWTYDRSSALLQEIGSEASKVYGVVSLKPKSSLYSAEAIVSLEAKFFTGPGLPSM
jgi:hypothetical protein